MSCSIVSRSAAVASTLALLAGGAAGHVRLIHPSNGNVLRWSSPSSVGIVINATGSDDIADQSHISALRLAIRAWNDASGTTVQLVEDTSSVSQARSDWDSDSIHMLIFDESNSSGYFAPGSGIVAITPVWFNSSGVISDADVLFNGSGFDFTTEAASGHFDVQDVATHELGHLLGLDHSGWAGSTMYPYVDPTVILHRSLSQDDECGMRDAYPSGSWARITGRILRVSDSSIVAGAHVVARGTNGRAFAAGLAGNDARFEIDGLPADDYELYASPLDAPVSSGNLGSGHTIAVNFRSTSLGTFSLATAQVRDVGDLFVDADTTLSLGRSSDDFPLRAVSGETRSFVLHGTGLAGTSTLEGSDPDVTVTPISWNSTNVAFSVTVPTNTPAGHFDLTATNLAGEKSILCAGVEITPPAPTVTVVSPLVGSISGGTAVTLTGTGFRSGARVVLGNRLYVDGDVGGATVVSPTTITLTTSATTAGLCDVVVMDATGVEGRSNDGYRFSAQPTITNVFPAIGWAGGGTTVVLRGTDFLAGSTVSIDDVVQTDVTIEDESTLRIVTTPGVAGGPYTIQVDAPGGGNATSAFSYAADPDPAISTIDPPEGPAEGGTVLTIHGSSFTVTTDVVFGADENDGSGGELATDITLVDANTLVVTTPASSAGAANVMVRDVLTEQASIMSAAFTFTLPDEGGGGGCSIAPVSRSSNGSSGFGAIALAFLVLLYRSRQPLARARVLTQARPR